MNAHTTLLSNESAQEILPTYDAKELTQHGVRAQITLDNQIYFLRITRAGKLILTK